MRQPSRPALILLAVCSGLLLVEPSSAWDHPCDSKCSWARYKLARGFNFTAAGEDESRFRAYLDNLDTAQRLNEEMPSAVFGETQFSHLTPQEFAARYLSTATEPRMEDAEEKREHPLSRRSGLPGTYLSPHMFAPRQQGTCGSCWAFTAAALTEAAWSVAGRGQYDVSEQQLLECTGAGDSCSGGNIGRALTYVRAISAEGMGMASEQAYPYNGVKGRTCRSDLADRNGPRIEGYWTTNGEANYANRLYEYGAVGVTMAGSILQYYVRGIILDSKSCHDKVSHGVLLAGWSVTTDGMPYWLVRNSWGPKWPAGNGDGYFRLQKGVGACNMTFYRGYYAEA